MTEPTGTGNRPPTQGSAVHGASTEGTPSAEPGAANTVARATASPSCLDDLSHVIANNIAACELIEEWRRTALSTNVEELRRTLAEQLCARFATLAVSTETSPSQLRDILLHQYDQCLLERRSLDSLGWAIYGTALTVSLTLLAFCFSTAASTFPVWAKIPFLILPYAVFLFGHSVHRKIRISRHIHRAVAMAIEDQLGLFHLTVSKTTNRPLRDAHDRALLLVSRAYPLVTLGAVVMTIVDTWVLKHQGAP